MSSTTYLLLGITYFVLSSIILIIILNVISRHEKKSYEDEITALERDKNLIISASILSELNKVETLVNNEKMREVFSHWQEKFKGIKDVEVPKITDELIEIEDMMLEKKYKQLKEKLALTEMDIITVKSKADTLLQEIKEITLSEERNRETITRLKTVYREIVTKYRTNKSDYKEISKPIELQIETVDKLFSAFESAMENNAYSEVGKIVKAIDDTVGNLIVVVEEAPSIILMGRSLIPNKVADIRAIHQKMIRDGYNLDYINLDYNIKETEKKIIDIFERLNVLNLEDSIFELKTMLDYFDSIYNDFDKEKISKKIFEDYIRTILVKTNQLEKINNNLYKRIGAIKYSYDLTDSEVKVIDIIKEELTMIKDNYNALVNANRSKSFAYSRLAKEVELINVNLSKTEDKLEIALRTLGSLKEDELRAREQLDEVKIILKKSKRKIQSFKLPVVPPNYFIELSEATDAVKEVAYELDKKPISIKILNTRVDTARDLVLKLYNTSNETIKTAKMAETTIVYGNRYRPIDKEVDQGLTKAENQFLKGLYKQSLEDAISAINVIEPGIHKKLIDLTDSKRETFE